MNYTVNFKQHDLFEINPFLQTVQNAGEYYLYNVNGRTGEEFNKVPNVIIPIDIGPAATTGFFNWSISVDDLLKILESLRTNFGIQYYRQIAYADDVWNFLTEYFWNLCRIGKQTFRYYLKKEAKTIRPDVTREWYSWGLVDNYQTLAQYRSSVQNAYRNTSKIISKQIITAGYNGSTVSDGVIKLIENLIDYNSRQEILYDHQYRNKINEYHGFWLTYSGTNYLGNGDNDWDFLRHGYAGIKWGNPSSQRSIYKKQHNDYDYTALFDANYAYVTARTGGDKSSAYYYWGSGCSRVTFYLLEKNDAATKKSYIISR